MNAKIMITTIFLLIRMHLPMAMLLVTPISQPLTATHVLLLPRRPCSPRVISRMMCCIAYVECSTHLIFSLFFPKLLYFNGPSPRPPHASTETSPGPPHLRPTTRPMLATSMTATSSTRPCERSNRIRTGHTGLRINGRREGKRQSRP